MHLLYAREFTKMMRDVGLVQQDEPFKRLFNQGQILGADGERMSKSRGNIQDPDDLVARYGADTVRLFLMFMGPWDQGGPWSPTGIGGVHRFLNRVWTLVLDPHGREPGDPDAGTLPAGQTEADAGRAIRARRPPDAPRRDRRLRGVPLQHDGRQADGAGEHRCSATAGRAVAGSAGVGRGRPAAAADAGAGRAAHHRGAVDAPAGGGRRALVVDPHRDLARRRRRARSSSRRARSRSRSTASCATRSSSPADATDAEIEAAVLARERILALLDGRTAGPDRRRAAAAGSSTSSSGDRATRRTRQRFDRHLDATAPDVADIAARPPPDGARELPGSRRSGSTRGTGCSAIGSKRSMRDLLFAIIPHRGHVNLQLADGVDLPNPDGRIEGTGKRIRHVKVRSVEEASAPWLRAVIGSQVAVPRRLTRDCYRR